MTLLKGWIEFKNPSIVLSCDFSYISFHLFIFFYFKNPISVFKQTITLSISIVNLQSLWDRYFITSTTPYACENRSSGDNLIFFIKFISPSKGYNVFFFEGNWGRSSVFYFEVKLSRGLSQQIPNFLLFLWFFLLFGFRQSTVINNLTNSSCRYLT